MSGPTLEQKLEHMKLGLAEAERRCAAGEPYPGPEGSWAEKIAIIQQHIADVREMMANE